MKKLALLMAAVMMVSLVSVYGLTVGTYSNAHQIVFENTDGGGVTARIYPDDLFVGGVNINSGQSISPTSLVAYSTPVVRFTANPSAGYEVGEWTLTSPVGADYYYYDADDNSVVWVPIDTALAQSVTHIHVTFVCDGTGAGGAGGGAVGGGGAGGAGGGTIGRGLGPGANQDGWREPRTSETTVSLAGTSIGVFRTGSSAEFDITSDEARQIIENIVGNTVVFEFSSIAGFSNIREARLPSGSMRRFADAGLSVEVRLPRGTVTLSPDILTSAVNQSSAANITVSVSIPARGLLNSQQRQATRHTDNVRMVRIMSGRTPITDFSGQVSVTIPISNWAGPYSVFSMDDRGSLTNIPATGDSVGQVVSFSTNQLPFFVIRGN